MQILQTITSYFAIAAAFLSSIFSWGDAAMLPFTNDYKIPDSIPGYSVISTAEKTDWKAKWIWDKENLTEKNVWMCFNKKVSVDKVPEELIAHVSADSKYWLYINGETVVFEGSVKRGPDKNSGYYDSIDIAPYLKEGENRVCALVWFWDNETSYSYCGSGQGGFLFEAIGEGVTIVSDKEWKVKRNSAYIDSELYPPNYRLPEYSIYFDAREDMADWINEAYDVASWEDATEYAVGGEGVYGSLYPRGIPFLKDYGLKDYVNSKDYENYTVKELFGKKITVDIPYNAQLTPYLKIIAPAGKKIRITTENTLIGAVSNTYITKEGEQEFEALGWFNGEHITYKIPKGVTVVSLKYRETGYDSSFCGNFKCDDEFLNSLWQKSLRTLYVTMRDNFMDCPDRERAQWWGDVTSEMIMTMYSMDSNSYLLYQKGVEAMLSHIDDTKVLQTVVPISGDYFELPVQQLAGITGFLTYYEYTGDKAFIEKVYDASLDYLKLWEIGENNLVVHRSGSWDWPDWGKKADMTAIENAWVYYALSATEKMAELLGEDDDISFITERKDIIAKGYKALLTEEGYKSEDAEKPDDRANALAVLSGLAEKEHYDTITNVLKTTKNSSPYMEYYVLEALCKMGEYEAARDRIKERYEGMVNEDYSTLWEFWNSWQGTMNHAWSGGPLVIMSKYFAGITPLEAGYEKVKIEPQYNLSDSISCTVPSVKGLITLNYENAEGDCVIDLTLPEGINAVLSVPDGAAVNINSKPFYRNGEYVNGYKTGDVEIVEAAHNNG
ncbi:MAG: alpha-L-rhamnosidase C-terminal domain-containing protein [Acutalibacteraceae bacterium]|nr:alpha-L-rhamnosidase C-terminal domain-containing protein [Acutalibacteraceae bacterium]